jgi:RNA polymerase sigma factor (sigma-70 family)
MSNPRDRGNCSATTAEWLESPYLAHVAGRVLYEHDLVRDDLEDLIQELRIALWEAGPEVRVSARWLFQVANHKAVDLFRKRVRRRRRDRVFIDGRENAAQDPELDYLLHARVARFSPSLRRFYDLRYLQGLSEREIARSLGLCRGSVRWLDRCCRRELAGESSA